MSGGGRAQSCVSWVEKVHSRAAISGSKAHRFTPCGVKGHEFLTTGGLKPDRWWPRFLPTGGHEDLTTAGPDRGSDEGCDAPAGEGLGQPDGVAAGLADVGVVK